MDDMRRSYRLIITQLMGIRDNFDQEFLPQEGRDLLDELVETCLSDYNIRFGSDPEASN